MLLISMLRRKRSRADYDEKWYQRDQKRFKLDAPWNLAAAAKGIADKGHCSTITEGSFFKSRAYDLFIPKEEEADKNICSGTTFDVTKKDKAWADAVVERAFVLSKDVDVRLSLFDMFDISELIVSEENPHRCTNIIVPEHSSPTQMQDVDVRQDLTEIPVTIDPTAFSTPKNLKPQTPVPAFPRHLTDEHRRRSAPSHLSDVSPRRSTRLADHHSSASKPTLPASPVVNEIDEKRSQQTKAFDQLKRLKSQEEARNSFEKDLKKYAIIARQKNSLFKDLRRGNVCKQCLTVDDRVLIKCFGGCGDHVHVECAKTQIPNEVRCPECSDVSSRICYACRRQCSEGMVRCCYKTCGRYYHKKCLDGWLQTKELRSGEVTCPSHVCHTCASVNPQNLHSECKDSEFTRCIKCPTTFCTHSQCIPAGVKLLTVNQHICIYHRDEKKKRYPPNLNWCYACGKNGGELLCCDLCPLVTHLECSKTEVVGDTWVCDSCETGRHPLYGEIVWVKYSSYKWWPAVIVPPSCITSVMTDRVHDDHDICVQFFGAYNCAWVPRRVIYLYEDDYDPRGTRDPKLDEAIKQADKWHKIKLCDKKKPGKVKPLPYEKITKMNQLAPAKLTRQSGYEAEACNCGPDDIDPCGPTSTCVNRESSTECDAKLCPAGAKCQNQGIGKKHYAKFIKQHFGDKGFGLIADTNISTGTLIIEYIGELVTKTVFQTRLKSKRTQNSYFMKYGKFYIDAEKMGNMSRFINHSCNPNCQTRVIIVDGFERIGIFAKKDIKKGDELTFNYGFSDGTTECYCGEQTCTGVIGGKIVGKTVGKRLSLA